MVFKKNTIYCSICGIKGVKIKMFNAVICAALTVHFTKTSWVKCVHRALLKRAFGYESHDGRAIVSLADADAVWRNVAESTSGSWNASVFICSGFNAITSAQAHKERVSWNSRGAFVMTGLLS